MSSTLSKLNGAKTYIIALMTVGYAIAQWWSGDMSQNAAMAMIFGALGAGAIRHGITTSTQGTVK